MFILKKYTGEKRTKIKIGPFTKKSLKNNMRKRETTLTTGRDPPIADELKPTIQFIGPHPNIYACLSVHVKYICAGNTLSAGVGGRGRGVGAALEILTKRAARKRRRRPE